MSRARSPRRAPTARPGWGIVTAGRGRRRMTAVAAAVAGLALLAGCGGGPSPQPDSTPGTLPVTSTTVAPGAPSQAFATGATLTIGLPGQPTNWNPLVGRPTAALAAVAAAVLPSAFVTAPDQTPALDTALLTSATSTGTAPQVVTYQIDPRATWSDGTPLTGADFVYTWQAQSGRAAYRDVGGARFTPSSTAAYRQVVSVTSTASDPDTVVVRLAHFDPDWQDLFSPLLPAHVARAVGFDHGFVDPVIDLVSAGPFVVQSYQPGDDVILVRNPRWWGPTADLATLTVDFVDSPAVAASSLQRGQLDAAVTAFDPAALAAVATTYGLKVDVSAGADYDTLVFDERSGPLAERAVRLALSLAVDRTALARTAAAGGDTAATPVANRFFAPGAAGYDPGAPPGSGAATPTGQAEQLLDAAGYRRQGATLTRDGRPVRLSLVVATTSPLAADEVAAVRAATTTLGIALTVVAPAAARTGAAVASGRYGLDLVEVGRSPDAAAGYAGGRAAGLDGYASSAMDALVSQLGSVTSVAERDELADRVDHLAWSDAVDLPLLAVPTVLVAQARYVGLEPDPAPVGIAWDAAQWGIPASA